MYNRIRRWEPWLVPFLPQHGSIAIDVGAAQGTWTLDLSERFKTVLAFEPHPKSYRELQQRVHNEAPQESFILTHNAAVGDTPGMMTLNLFESPDHTSMSKELEAWRSEDLDTEIRVRAHTLDEIIFSAEWASDVVDFVKVDTEGAEELVMIGGARIAEEFRPVWLIEYHSNENLHKCQHLFEHWRYKTHIIPHPNMAVEGHGWIHAT